MKLRPTTTRRAPRHHCDVCGGVFKRAKFAMLWHPRREATTVSERPAYTATCPGCGAPADRMRRVAKE